MQTTEVRFEVPSEIAEDLGGLSHFGYQSFVLRLYLDEEISFGKAAELLNMSHEGFMDFLGQRKIPFFRDSVEDIRAALDSLKPI